MAGTKSNCELPQKKIKEVDERLWVKLYVAYDM